jgi:Flp pilus assembly pilin Flp
MRAFHRRRPRSDDGSTTVEYAVVTLAVAAFAAVLYSLLTGDSVVSWLTKLVMKALSVPS